MRVSEIRVKRIRVNQGLGVFCTALTDQSAEKKYQIHLSLHITWDI